jgi:hypothetical protein
MGPWDDIKLMGLNAIEIFTSSGTTPEITKIETSAEETYGELENLLFCTTCPSRDPSTMWSCVYDAEKLPITITMYLSQVETIALLRVWVNNLKKVIHFVFYFRTIANQEFTHYGAFVGCEYSWINNASLREK